jgi:hypothetical protein
MVKLLQMADAVLPENKTTCFIPFQHLLICILKPDTMKHTLILLPYLFFCVQGRAQSDPEFPKGWVMYLEAQQGVVTAFNSSPDLFAASLSLSPQITIIPQHLRLGASGGVAFTNKEFSALFGPRVALKLKTIKLQRLGSLFNLQFQLEHLWGSRDERLFGGGLCFEIIQMLDLSIRAHRDYSLGNWWFQAGAGFNLLYKKRKSVTGTDPMDPH